MVGKWRCKSSAKHQPTIEHTEDTLTRDSINLLLENGLSDGLPRIAELLMNAAMIIE